MLPVHELAYSTPHAFNIIATDRAARPTIGKRGSLDTERVAKVGARCDPLAFECVITLTNPRALCDLESFG